MNAEHRLLHMLASPKNLIDKVNDEQNQNKTRERVGDHPKELVSNVRQREDVHLRGPEARLIFEIPVPSCIRTEDKKVRGFNNDLKNEPSQWLYYIIVL